jgi:hypothetical protein
MGSAPRADLLEHRQEVAAALDARHPPLVHGDQEGRVPHLDQEDRGEIGAAADEGGGGGGPLGQALEQARLSRA